MYMGRPTTPWFAFGLRGAIILPYIQSVGEAGQVLGEHDHDHVLITDISIYYLYLYNHGIALDFGYSGTKKNWTTSEG